MSRENLQDIVNVARDHGLIVHSDEVYRPLFHSWSGDEAPPSILSMGYEKAVATGSMSKAFSLAGIRLGWIASRSSEIIEACASARDYTLISVSQLDDQVASFALSKPTVQNILQRNTDLAQQNLKLLDAFVMEYSWACRWVRPTAGTTAFIQFCDRSGRAIDAVEFCKQLQAGTGVMFVPGSRCFGNDVEYKGFVRIGYVPEHKVFADGLQQLMKFMETNYAQLPPA